MSFLIPAYRCSDTLEYSVLSIRDYLKNQFHDDFEIIIIPNGPHVEESQTYKIAAELARRFPEVKVVNHKGQRGKGFSLRAGFAQSLGKYVFFTDADLPYDLSFFSAAAQMLSDGVDFISGNRRLPQSHFTVPVYLLNLVYRRHCIGLLFNRMVRMLFPIKTSDTQAGIKAMSRRMAEVAFSRQICPGFLFDIEFFLCCTGFQFQSTEIPVTFFLRSEKSTVQLLREGVLAGIWLAKIFWRYKKGWYAATDQLGDTSEIEVYKSAHIKKGLGEPTSLPLISADDWGLSPGVNEGILDLARRGIVRRVSILASGLFVREGLAELKTLPQLTLGLHFSLTFGNTYLGDRNRLLTLNGQFHLSPTRIALLFLLSSAGKRKRLAQEVILLLREQLSILESYGICPEYLDCHHHIHLVPGMMKSLLPILCEVGLTQVRVPLDPKRLLSRINPIIILALWARLRWKRWGLTFLPCVYPSARDFEKEDRLRYIVAQKGGYEMIVHPAAHDDVFELGVPDDYPGDRVREYQVLCSLEPLFLHEKERS